MQPRRATDIGVVDESTFRKATGLQHLATSKWGTLREAIRHTDRPQKHSIADERRCRIASDPTSRARDCSGEE